jgi:glycosyltransferase involved in cell wall biosynthesis
LKDNLISVIIPVYNVEKYLSRCIESLLEQDFFDFELLLIDDGSLDNSGKICDEYAKKDYRIQVHHKKNGGVSSARNVGLYMAKGKWACFVDSDDWVNKSYLSDFFLYPMLENAIVIQGLFFEFPNHKKRIFFSYDNKSTNLDFKESFIVENKLFHNGSPVAKLFDMEIVKSNNILFNEHISFNEDHLFVLEYYKYVESVTLLSAMNYHYWFNYFETTLTKKKHSFSELMTASKEFHDMFKILTKRFHIIDHAYLCSLYTICGINQMFLGLINSCYSKNMDFPFSLRFVKFIELHEFILNYYFPKEISLKLSKYFVLNHNVFINNIFFYVLAYSLSFHKILIRLIKRIMIFVGLEYTNSSKIEF